MGDPYNRGAARREIGRRGRRRDGHRFGGEGALPEHRCRRGGEAITCPAGVGDSQRFGWHDQRSDAALHQNRSALTERDSYRVRLPCPAQLLGRRGGRPKQLVARDSWLTGGGDRLGVVRRDQPGVRYRAGAFGVGVPDQRDPFGLLAERGPDAFVGADAAAVVGDQHGPGRGDRLGRARHRPGRPSRPPGRPAAESGRRRGTGSSPAAARSAAGRPRSRAAPAAPGRWRLPRRRRAARPGPRGFPRWRPAVRPGRHHPGAMSEQCLRAPGRARPGTAG